MTPEPGPRPAATLGCFVLFVGGLFAVAIFGPRLGSGLTYALVAGVLVALVYVLARILARRR